MKSFAVALSVITVGFTKASLLYFLFLMFIMFKCVLFLKYVFLFVLLKANSKYLVQEGNEICDDSQFLGEFF